MQKNGRNEELLLSYFSCLLIAHSDLSAYMGKITLCNYARNKMKRNTFPLMIVTDYIRLLESCLQSRNDVLTRKTLSSMFFAKCFSYDSKLCFEYTIDITPCPVTGESTDVFKLDTFFGFTEF
jgi:hypothetical protein